MKRQTKEGGLSDWAKLKEVNTCSGMIAELKRVGCSTLARATLQCQM